MDAKQYLASFSEKFEKSANLLFRDKIKSASKIDPIAVTALKNLETYMFGGKKVRGGLTSLGFEIAGKKQNPEILKAAFAVEMMHSCLLIHDDFVDNDETRRGKPTMHKVYLGKNGPHYAASMAIITADIGIFWSNQIMSGLTFDAKRSMEAMNKFNFHLLNTGYGEIMDIDYDYRPETSWEDILNIRVYKTAYYTFIMPLTVGAVLGGAGAEVLKNIEKFGYNVGLAFQLRDDVLGVFGDTGETGKSNESDILEGKKSILYFKALEAAKPKEKQFLKKYYGKITAPSQVTEIRRIIKDSGALDYSAKTARDYIERGKKFIPKITKSKDITQTLSTFADYMIERTK